MELSIHDVSDQDIEDTQHDAVWKLQHGDDRAGAVVEHHAHGFTYRNEPACIRCYMRGVPLHPTLEMCEPCCKWEGVK